MADKQQKASSTVVGSGQRAQSPSEEIQAGLAAAENYIRECKRDATEASSRKRLGRKLNFILGIVIAGLGFIVASTEYKEWQDTTRLVIGLVNVLAGATVTALSQRLDPEVSRERAINLRSAVLDLEKLKRDTGHDLARLEEDGAAEECYRALSKTMYDELDNLKRSAHNLGIKV